MDDLSFLEEYAVLDTASDATLRVQIPNGQVCQVSDRIRLYRLLDSCPLLYHAFEYGVENRLQASIEASSVSAVISLLRYCYTSTYLPIDPIYSPILFLPHAEAYKIAEDFDIPELQLIAHGNFSCQINFACSIPVPPSDLLETIRFLYLYFSSYQSRQSQDLLSSILNYCIAMFEYHNLGASHEFLDLVREIPAFRKDLCRTNIERNFEDDCAFDIIRLALDATEPRPAISPTLLSSRDLPEEMLVDQWPIPELPQAERPFGIKTEYEDSIQSNTTAIGSLPAAVASSASTLVFRPKPQEMQDAAGFETDASSDEDGYSIVRRPRDEDLMSSPELIPTPRNVLAETGSDYPDDDDWTTIDI